jgi:hypothetical protein
VTEGGVFLLVFIYNLIKVVDEPKGIAAADYYYYWNIWLCSAAAPDDDIIMPFAS